MTDRSSPDATAPPRSDRLPRRLIGLAAALCCVALCVPFRAFVLDDSFITFRYALNLVEHGTLAWNVGQQPVEGFTSLLWVLVNALGMLVSLDPVVTSKLVALASTLAILAVLLRKERDAPLGLRAALVAGLAASPALALLTMQGMETATTTLIVLFVAREVLAAGEGVDRRRALRLAALFFLALLARPDTAVFGAGAGAVLVAVHAVRRDLASLKALTLCVSAFVAAVGVYTAWRWWVFGELLPNTYYVKMNADDPLRAELGKQYVTAFLQMYLGPYLALGAVAALFASSRARFLRALPVLFGAGLFVFYVSGIRPLQGMGGRFLFPVVPALFLAILALADARRPLCRALAHPVAWVCLLGLSGAWVLQHTALILDVRNSFSPTDRVAAGKGLAGLDGRMFVSESGALPYYSRWTTLDRVGLTSDVIAHGGLTRDVLEAFAPDLIQDIGRTGNYTVNQVNRMQVDYMREHGFVAIAATKRHGRTIHYYFARPDSPLFDECVLRLRTLPGVEQAPLEGQIHVPGLAIQP
ncbi:MAG: hypothetical protein H6831_15855 [Planctomycetes bacterium]|nr:hypothetical protein [Planctomycetota bacterium]MCB9905874.1 hypothetical protein [Planctomycetota bacterium]